MDDSTLLRRPRRASRSERGAAAVEFGLVALLLVTLLLGTIQFGLWLWCWQAGGHAAREAARFAAVHPCDRGGITEKARVALEQVPTTAAPSIEVQSTNPMKTGDDITVKIEFSTVDLGLFPGFDGVVRKSATSRVEYVPARGC